jgi:hypothetical protein
MFSYSIWLFGLNLFGYLADFRLVIWLTTWGDRARERQNWKDNCRF